MERRAKPIICSNSRKIRPGWPHTTCVNSYRLKSEEGGTGDVGGGTAEGGGVWGCEVGRWVGGNPSEKAEGCDCAAE